MTSIRSITARLYQAMPDAPPPPIDDGRILWGEIDNEHWQFCNAIAAELSMLHAKLETLHEYTMSIRQVEP
jgi:hypothetical protein